MVGTSMNFGLTGSIAERVLLVLKDRNGIEAAEHRHRLNELSDLAGRGGGIVGEDAVFEAHLEYFEVDFTSVAPATFQPHLSGPSNFFDFETKIIFLPLHLSAQHILRHG